MAEFKKGDRVVFTKGDSWGMGDRAVKMPAGTLGTYLGTRAWRAGAPWVRLDTGELVCAWATSIAHAEDHGTGDVSASDICAKPGCNCDLERRFPAPLDPSKVKAGDTVTVRVEPNPGTAFDGPLDHGPEAIEVTGKVWLDSGDNPHGPVAKVSVHALGLPNVTLTAHTPAPEPEPEWKPGTFVSGEFEGRRGQGVVTEQGEFLFWNHTGGHMQEEPLSTIADVRPLVVIDPADVDVVALQREIDDAMPGHEASVALGHLGLNR